MNDRPSFELKRFAWAAPDRLDLSGVFSGLGEEPAGEPSLVVDGAAGAHRLPAVAGSVSGSPASREPWEATFLWQEVPVAFEQARLEFEGGLRVELPPPGTKRTLRRHVLEVQTPNGDRAEPADPVGPAGDAEAPAASAAPAAPAAPADGLRLQAALLAAEEQVRESQTAVQQAEAELGRARADLAAEREGRATDSERFRHVLETFRASAEEAVAAEQSAAAKLGADLREASDAAAAARGELQPLRERLAALEQSAAQADALRAELEDARGQAQAARAELATARGALDEARADAERLLGHLTPGTDSSAGG